mmetsp:Transcript_1733/g.4265  ORF Transcript_1733/g.4265 Transcript_1733/m.4265 type:complete len:220 (-) Transcript_1733:1160-1819(-)
MSFMSVSRASLPKESLSPWTRVYASSTNRMPPSASLTRLVTLIAVCPTYPATSEARSASTRCPEDSRPSSASSAAMMRATVVLPVPGLPEKIMCREPELSAGSPAFLRWSSNSSCACSERTKRLTSASPTMASSWRNGEAAPTAATATPLPPVKSAISSVVRLSFERVPQAYTRRVCAAIAASRQFAAWRVVPRPLLARLHISSICERTASSSSRPRSR